jgi:hypothetical protein
MACDLVWCKGHLTQFVTTCLNRSFDSHSVSKDGRNYFIAAFKNVPYENEWVASVGSLLVAKAFCTPYLPKKDEQRYLDAIFESMAKPLHTRDATRHHPFTAPTTGIVIKAGMKPSLVAPTTTAPCCLCSGPAGFSSERDACSKELIVTHVHPACVAMWALRGLPIIGVPLVLEWSGYRETLLSHVQRVAASSDMCIVTQTFSDIVKHAVAFAGAVGSNTNMLTGNQSYRIAQSILDEASSGLATLEMLQTFVSTASSAGPCDHWSAARDGIAVLQLQFKDILRPKPVSLASSVPSKRDVASEAASFVRGAGVCAPNEPAAGIARAPALSPDHEVVGDDSVAGPEQYMKLVQPLLGTSYEDSNRLLPLSLMRALGARSVVVGAWITYQALHGTLPGGTSPASLTPLLTALSATYYCTICITVQRCL